MGLGGESAVAEEVGDVEGRRRLERDGRRAVDRQLQRETGHRRDDDRPVEEDARAPEVDVVSGPGLSEDAARPEGDLEVQVQHLKAEEVQGPIPCVKS